MKALLSSIVDLHVTENVTISNPSSARNMERCIWRIWNEGNAPITVTLGNQFNFGTNITEIPAIPAGKVGYVAAICRTAGLTRWDVVSADLFPI